MAVESSLFLIQCDFYKELEHTYFYHLKRFAKENNLAGVQTIFEKVMIPDRILSYANLHLSSSDVLEVILKEKLNLDNFVKHSLNLLAENDNKNAMNLKDFDLIVDKLDCKVADEMYRKYLLLNLFRYKDVISICNIICKYKNFSYYYDKLICDALYCADNEFVKNCLDLSSKFNYEFQLEPFSRISHQHILKWLSDNVRNGNRGDPVGWMSGPDSVIWPSTNAQDYTEALNLIQPYVKLSL